MWSDINRIAWILTEIIMTYNVTTFSKQPQLWWGWISLFYPSWWRHQMETFSTLLALCAGNSPVTGEFPAQRPVTLDVSCDLRMNKRLSKQLGGWWFETPSRSLWRQCNVPIWLQTLRDITLSSLVWSIVASEACLPVYLGSSLDWEYFSVNSPSEYKNIQEWYQAIFWWVHGSPRPNQNNCLNNEFDDPDLQALGKTS